MKKVILILLVVLFFIPLSVSAQTSRHAIIIANNSHGSCRIFATTCGRLMKDVLREHGWSSKEITLLFNSQATKENFEEEINRIKDVDEVVVAFFGHGSYNYVMLHKQGIWHFEIRDILETLTSEKQLVIIDTCKSYGAIVPGMDGISLNKTGRIVLTSTRSELESSIYHWHLTVWCRAVLKSGLLEGNADFNEDGRVSIQEAGSMSGGMSDGYGEEFFS